MIIFVSDLDQTLIFSRNFIDRNHASEQELSLQAVELIDGADASFCTFKTLDLLREISKKTLFIPATTRTVEQFNRVMLKKNLINYKYSIASNGGNIICDGEIDLDWNGKVKKRITTDCCSFDEVGKWMDKMNERHNFIVSKRNAEDLFLYYIIDQEMFDNDILEEAREFFDKYNWNVSIQLRKLYFTPKFLDKAHGLEEIKTREENASKTIASGDAFLDLAMIRSSDYGFVPRHGELAKKYRGEMGENIYISKQEGVFATEEILHNVLVMLS